MSNQAAVPKYLEDLPEDDIPPDIKPISRTTLELLEGLLSNDRATITIFQKQFAWHYTRHCLEKGLALRLPLAALGYSYQHGNANRSEKETEGLKRLVAAVRALPPDQMAMFKSLADRFAVPQTAESKIILGGGPSGPDREEKAAANLRPAHFIAAMQQFLKVSPAQPFANFHEAVAQARTALEHFPEHPDILVQAAVCFKTRAARERDLPLELRVQDMQHAVELMEQFISVSLRPDYREIPEFRSRRTVVNTQCEAMRKTLAEAQKRLAKKKDEK